MEIKDVNVWKPIGFDENWEKVSTSRLDVLLPSWVRKRQTLKDDSREYKVFMDRLKRQHAIETGIVERLYDLSEGITETFIKEGFVESYLQHGDTNIPTGQLMDYLQDNFDAIDFVFDVVKNDRPITKSFIKELHQLVTKHQHTTEALNQLNKQRVKVPLLKGEFKQADNYPTRADGTRFLYCPPIHVESEMDRLVSILEGLENRKTKPLVIATWLHHAFTQIHPFQDGNGRMARLLASLVLIKGGLFPLTVKRNEKKRYIDSLELADNGEPQKLVDYFGEIQKRNIEAALNMRLEVELSSSSMLEMADTLASKIDSKLKEKEVYEESLSKLWPVFNFCENELEKLKTQLEKRIKSNTKFKVENWYPLRKGQVNGFQPNIEEYAKKFGYHYNSNLSSAGLILTIEFLEENKYQIIFSLHYFGYGNNTIAIGAFLEKNINNSSVNPIDLSPFTISLENDIGQIESNSESIKSFLQNIVTIALAQITTELN